jgi:hypothetical protein
MGQLDGVDHGRADEGECAGIGQDDPDLDLLRTGGACNR